MRNLLFLFFLLSANQLFAQNLGKSKDDTIQLDNGSVMQKIVFRQDSLYSTFLSLKGAGSYNFIEKSKDFSFVVDGEEYNGFTGWELSGIDSIHDDTGGKGARIILREKAAKPRIIVELNYLLYPGLPIIRKWIKIQNIGPLDIKLESLTTEALATDLSYISSVVLHNYARMKHLGKFIGNWDDPVVVVHDITHRRGMALGNEAIGVLKRTAYHTDEGNNIEIGLTRPGQSYPFRKSLKPGEAWEAPKVFICPYANRDDGFQVVDNQVNKFMIKYMKPRIIGLKEKPTFVYNTWYPFRTFVSDSLVREVAKAAAECGVQEFIIDDGWQVNNNGKTSTKSWGGNYGDWLVDSIKFPRGLKSTFDYLKSLGMKPGLWIALAAATPDSKVFSEHPEWFVQTSDGKPGNLHYQPADGKFFTASFATKWYDYIKQTILRLVGDYGLSYTKLDLAVATSPYINNDSISGDYAKGNPYFKDHEESFLVIYNRLLNLFDELHTQAPELFIDCTFETAGELQLMDYATAKHADGNWLSNFEEPSPVGPLRVRQMAWWRSPALPASSLVIGNLFMNDPNFMFGLKSLIGTLPIVLGDPRKIPVADRKTVYNWSEWMQKMEKQYDYMSYRKDLPGFGEPKEGAWDGWQRINFETQRGGIFGVFRQGALEDNRTVFLDDLKPDKNYVIRSAPSGKVIYRGKGEELMRKGIIVRIEKMYDAKIFEVGIDESR